jgi:hypothetical protein
MGMFCVEFDLKSMRLLVYLLSFCVHNDPMPRTKRKSISHDTLFVIRVQRLSFIDMTVGYILVA